MLRIAQMWQDFQQVRISIDRTGDILNATPEFGASVQGRLPPINGIYVHGVEFRYRVGRMLERSKLAHLVQFANASHGITYAPCLKVDHRQGKEMNRGQYHLKDRKNAHAQRERFEDAQFSMDENLVDDHLKTKVASVARTGA